MPEPDGRISVVIVDDHLMVAESIAAILSRQGDIDVLGIAVSVREGVELVASRRPDVVVMDFSLPDGDGGDATSSIRARDPDAKVIMLTGSEDADVLAKAIQAGCAGFLVKGLQIDELGAAVRAVSRGEMVIHVGTLMSALPSMKPPEKNEFGLTDRELDVLRGLAMGETTEQLAQSLFIARNTARNHISTLLTKMGAHSRLEAVATALRLGLVTIS